ncbi:unnamed protein product [Cladocopium goreaui]|uniref:Uncharacterized protein n=1 Tax=Cladocopium goreaui TaxID=2562237 RepID=A0A9P1GFM6_9DINO|nr:unnamed protein product [Cladocopium goreaui]
MFDDLDDVGLMAQLQGTLKEEELAAPEDESAEEADAEEAKESESHGEVCANVAKGICLNKEAPRCKTPFSASDRGGVFAGVFCHSCSEILECGWGEDRKKVDL